MFVGVTQSGVKLIYKYVKTDEIILIGTFLYIGIIA